MKRHRQRLVGCPMVALAPAGAALAEVSGACSGLVVQMEPQERIHGAAEMPQRADAYEVGHFRCGQSEDQLLAMSVLQLWHPGQLQMCASRDSGETLLPGTAEVLHTLALHERACCRRVSSHSLCAEAGNATADYLAGWNRSRGAEHILAKCVGCSPGCESSSLWTQYTVYCTQGSGHQANVALDHRDWAMGCSCRFSWLTRPNNSTIISRV